MWTEGGTLPKEVCRRLLLGVDLEDGPARALACRPAPGGAVLVLAEGRAIGLGVPSAALTPAVIAETWGASAQAEA